MEVKTMRTIEKKEYDDGYLKKLQKEGYLRETHRVEVHFTVEILRHKDAEKVEKMDDEFREVLLFDSIDVLANGCGMEYDIKELPAFKNTNWEGLEGELKTKIFIHKPNIDEIDTGILIES